jgi:hypothetical protein
LRAEGDALEFAALSKDTSTDDSAKASSLGKLPDDTVFGLSVGGAGKELDTAIDEGLAELKGLFDLEGMAEGAGFNLREDLKTLVGNGMTFALGAANLETIPSLSSPEDLAKINLALATKGDKAKTLDLATRIADLAGALGITLVAGPTDDGAVLATNQEAADAIAKPAGRLGDEKTFKQVIPGGSDAGGLFINIATIVSKFQETDLPDGLKQETDPAKDLTGLGFSSSPQGDDHTLMRIRLGFK